MKALPIRFITAFFGGHLDFRVRLFNVMAFVGVFCGLFMGGMNAVSRAGIADMVLCFSTAVAAATILWYSKVSGNYRVCYVVTVVVIFLGLFPAMFFSAGGYHSGMMSFFIFSVLFTIFMLKGKMMIVLSVFELAVYTGICVIAYLRPDLVNSLDARGAFLDTLLCFLIVCVVLGITMILHFRLYDEHLRELEAARRLAEGYAKMKSDIFARMSHEMRTPLAVMSTYAQYAVEQIKEGRIDAETIEDLNVISEESARLAEMADGTLNILKAVSRSDDAGVHEDLPVDIAALARRLSNLMKPIAARNGCLLSADIDDRVGSVVGDAESLTQLLWNILQNAITHSGAKAMLLRAEAAEDRVVITAEDNGRGIPPDLLPRVFEHGVSGSPNGSGIGLYVCREIVKRHGGGMEIENITAGGVRVTVSLPRAASARYRYRMQ